MFFLFFLFQVTELQKWRPFCTSIHWTYHTPVYSIRWIIKFSSFPVFSHQDSFFIRNVAKKSEHFKLARYFLGNEATYYTVVFSITVVLI